jgi:hypothetical protein
MEYPKITLPPMKIGESVTITGPAIVEPPSQQTIIAFDRAQEDVSLVTLEYKEYQRVQAQAAQAEALARALEWLIEIGPQKDWFDEMGEVEDWEALKTARKAVEEYRK